MRVDATLRTLAFLILVHAVVLIPGVPTVIRAAITLAFAVVAGWQFVAIFGLGETRPLDRLIYAVATSITALMLLGLIANMLLPFIGVERPLQAATALVILDILLVSGMIVMFRTSEQKKDDKVRQDVSISFGTATLWVLAAAPALLAAIGAQTLNAGGGPLLTGIAIVLVVLLITGILCFGARTSDATAAWVLFCSALTLLWIGWLRSNFVSGVDINVEYHLLEHTLNAGRWSLATYQDSYNACMSITILPALLGNLSGLGPTTVFKLVMPSLFALLPVATFIFLRRYVSTTLAIAGATFVIAQHAFLLWWTIPIKQEVGLLMFSTMLLLISDRDLQPRTRFVSILVVGLGMVVAHYTTTYVALSLLLMTSIIVLVYRAITKTASGKKLFTWARLYSPAQEKQQRSAAIPLIAVLILMAATVSWYGLITNTEGSTIASVQQVASSLGSVFDDDVRQAGALTSVFNPLAEPPDESELLEAVAADVESKANEPGRYDPITYRGYAIEAVRDVISPVAVPTVVKQGAFAINELMKTLIKILLLVGVWLLLSRHLRRGDIEFEVVILVLFAFLVLAAMLFLPFASIVYSVSRAYQQVALIVALAFALGVGAAVSMLERFRLSPLSGISIAFILMVPILFYTGLVPLLVGGTSPTTMLANEGRNYDEVYVNRGEVLAAQWVFDNTQSDAIYASSRAKEKLWLDQDFIMYRTAYAGVFPQSIHREGYVYADSTNTIREVGFAASAGTTLSYRYPIDFLESQKHVIYSTQTATVYR